MIAAAALFLIALASAGTAGSAEIPLAERKSDYEFMGRETRAMQDDDTANPATLWVLDGETLWQRKDGSAGKSCGDCHGDARTSMKGVATRYPAFDAARGRPVNLEERINICRAEKQQATPLPFESKELLAVPRRQLGAKTCRRSDPTGPPDRISAVSSRMADTRIAAAAAAQLPVRHTRRLLSLWRARIGQSRTLSDVARTRHAARNAGGAAVDHSI